MNRKQHIKMTNLKRHIINLKFLLTQSHAQDFHESAQYAIDHLSREWVSRKTHRKKVDELQGECNRLLLKCTELEQPDLVNSMENFLNQTRERQKKNLIIRLKAEIDQLKADKDRLINTLEGAQSHFREEIDSWQKDWEKESDKVSELKNQNKWLIISSTIGLILFLICLFTR